MQALLRRGALAALLLLSHALPARAEPLTESDVAAIRSVIYRQLDAFRRDNAKAAFSLASPQLRAEFKTPEGFMREVRASRAPLFRSSSVAFRAVWILDDEVVQQVSVTDERGAVWSAYYPMERQKDGTWRTNGCRLVGKGAVSI
jgi:hypothetical protein